MTEWSGRRNFELNGSTILRDLYRLTTMFFADSSLMAAASEAEDPLRRLRERYVDDELVHLLVGTAVTNRIQLEHMSGPRGDPDELSFPPLERDCGQWRRNVDVLEWQPLPFREACNKIVHANNVVVQYPPPIGRQPVEPILTNTISLRGEQNGVTWLAHLDVFQYVRASALNFDDAL